MFAVIGSAVDNETDTQQLIWPVILPLILGIYVMISAINNPDSSLAFWFSIIPFTSPVVMMVRIPFGVPWWQLALAGSLLVMMPPILVVLFMQRWFVKGLVEREK